MLRILAAFAAVAAYAALADAGWYTGVVPHLGPTDLALAGIGGAMALTGLAPLANRTSLQSALRLAAWLREQARPYLGDIPAYSLPLAGAGLTLLYWTLT